MPTSRGRRRSHARLRSGPRTGVRGVDDPTSPEFRRNICALFAADAAEARGDAAGALDAMEELLAQLSPGEEFWRPWRTRRLLQITALGPLLPPWATSRWILAQALHYLDPRPDGMARTRQRRAFEIAAELCGADRLPGVDRADAMCRVMDHDWVFRQLHLYELGGLAHFLRSGAAGDLVVGADQVRAWATTPMGGFRLRDRGSDTVTWTDLSTGSAIVTANIGSAALVEPGECVIGRMVPIVGGSMFECAPLFVPDEAAARVAAAPADWVEALRAVPGGTGGAWCGPVGDVSGLVYDVPEVVWVSAVCDAGGLMRQRSPLTPPVLARAALDLAREAVDPTREPGPDEVDLWSCVGAALLAPEGLDGIGEAVRPTDLPLLTRLGEVLAEPAAGWCRMLAEELSEAA